MLATERVLTGVPTSILSARGYGDTRPRAGNDTEYGSAKTIEARFASPFLHQIAGNRLCVV